MRNTNCPLYSLCLNEACERRVSGWDCDSCPWRNSKAAPETLEMTGYYILLLAIFHPEAYKEYLKKMQPGRDEIISSVFTRPWMQDLKVNWWGDPK